MKCIVCGFEFVPREIEVGYLDPVKRDAGLVEQKKQNDEMAGWEHIQLVTTRNGSCSFQVLAGDVCPRCRPQPGKVKIVLEA